MSQTCDIDPALLEKLEAFRFAKRSQGNAALICKIDSKELMILEDHDEKNVLIEDLADLLPENTPRYVVLSYELKHDDGRQSYPLVFLYYSPSGVRPELNMLYASAKTYFQNKVGLGKVFDLQDAEDLTDGWLRAKLLK
ncbi:MAG: glia maturation factor gamma-like protein [Linnemannia elongata]|nr:MAG: glia maturation factor gamma-like protein [Linnemannia elongata]